MSLETPIAIRTLQRKLYRKAKQEPDFRFYPLYDKIYHEEVLQYAYALAKTNQGAPGVDGQSFEAIESEGLEVSAPYELARCLPRRSLRGLQHPETSPSRY